MRHFKFTTFKYLSSKHASFSVGFFYWVCLTENHKSPTVIGVRLSRARSRARSQQLQWTTCVMMLLAYISSASSCPARYFGILPPHLKYHFSLEFDRFNVTVVSMNVFITRKNLSIFYIDLKTNIKCFFHLCLVDPWLWKDKNFSTLARLSPSPISVIYHGVIKCSL